MPNVDKVGSDNGASSTKKQRLDKPHYKLTYFNLRWLAEPIRFIFSYKNIDFEDVRIEDKEWEKVKLDYPYGVLPVLEMDDVKLSQSFAIARFLGKKYNLAGSDYLEAAKLDEYADCVKDLLKEVEQMYTDDETRKMEVKKNVLNKAIPKFLAPLDEDIKTNGGKYLVGDNFTWVDFLLAHFTELFEGFVDKTILDKYPAVKAHQENVFNIPQIKEWIAKRPVTEA